MVRAARGNDRAATINIALAIILIIKRHRKAASKEANGYSFTARVAGSQFGQQGNQPSCFYCMPGMGHALFTAPPPFCALGENVDFVYLIATMPGHA